MVIIAAVNPYTLSCFYFIAVVTVALELVSSTPYKPQSTDEDNHLTNIHVLLDRIKRDLKKHHLHHRDVTALQHKQSGIYNHHGHHSRFHINKNHELFHKMDGLGTAARESKRNLELSSISFEDLNDEKDNSLPHLLKHVHMHDDKNTFKLAKHNRVPNGNHEYESEDEEELEDLHPLHVNDDENAAKRDIIFTKHEHSSKKSKTNKAKVKGSEQLPSVVLDRIGAVRSDDETDNSSAAALDVTNAEVQTQSITDAKAADASTDALDRPKAEMNHNELNKLSPATLLESESDGNGADESTGLTKVKTSKSSTGTAKKSDDNTKDKVKPVTENTDKTNSSFSQDESATTQTVDEVPPVDGDKAEAQAQNETTTESSLKDDSQGGNLEKSDEKVSEFSKDNDSPKNETIGNQIGEPTSETEASQDAKWTAETDSIGGKDAQNVTASETSNVEQKEDENKVPETSSVPNAKTASAHPVHNQKSFSDMIVEDVINKKNNLKDQATQVSAVAQQLSNPDALMKGIGLIPASDVKTVHNPVTGQRILPFLGNRKTAKHFHAFYMKPSATNKSQLKPLLPKNKVNKYAKANPGFHHHHNLKYMYPLNYNNFLSTNMMMNYSKNNVNFNNVLKRSGFLGYPRSLMRKPAPYLSSPSVPYAATASQPAASMAPYYPPNIPMMAPASQQAPVQANQEATTAAEPVRDYEQHIPARLSSQPFAPPPKPNIYDTILKSIHPVNKKKSTADSNSNRTTSYLNSFYQHVKKITTDKNFWNQILGKYSNDPKAGVAQAAAGSRKEKIPRNMTKAQLAQYKKYKAAHDYKLFKQKKQPLVKCYKGHCQKVRMYTDVRGSKKDILIGRLAPMMDGEELDPYGEYASEIPREQLFDTGDDAESESDGVNFEENSLRGKPLIRKFTNGESPKGIEVQGQSERELVPGQAISMIQRVDDTDGGAPVALGNMPQFDVLPRGNIDNRNKDNPNDYANIAVNINGNKETALLPLEQTKESNIVNNGNEIHLFPKKDLKNDLLRGLPLEFMRSDDRVEKPTQATEELLDNQARTQVQEEQQPLPVEDPSVIPNSVTQQGVSDMTFVDEGSRNDVIADDNNGAVIQSAEKAGLKDGLVDLSRLQQQEALKQQQHLDNRNILQQLHAKNIVFNEDEGNRALLPNSAVKQYVQTREPLVNEEIQPLVNEERQSLVTTEAQAIEPANEQLRDRYNRPQTERIEQNDPEYPRTATIENREHDPMYVSFTQERAQERTQQQLAEREKEQRAQERAQEQEKEQEVHERAREREGQQEARERTQEREAQEQAHERAQEEAASEKATHIKNRNFDIIDDQGTVEEERPTVTHIWRKDDESPASYHRQQEMSENSDTRSRYDPVQTFLQQEKEKQLLARRKYINSHKPHLQYQRPALITAKYAKHLINDESARLQEKYFQNGHGISQLEMALQENGQGEAVEPIRPMMEANTGYHDVTASTRTAQYMSQKQKQKQSARYSNGVSRISAPQRSVEYAHSIKSITPQEYRTLTRLSNDINEAGSQEDISFREYNQLINSNQELPSQELSALKELSRLSGIDEPLPVREESDLIGRTQILSRRNVMPPGGGFGKKPGNSKRVVERLKALAALGQRLDKTRNTTQFSHIAQIVNNYLRRLNKTNDLNDAFSHKLERNETVEQGDKRFVTVYNNGTKIYDIKDKNGKDGSPIVNNTEAFSDLYKEPTDQLKPIDGLGKETNSSLGTSEEKEKKKPEEDPIEKEVDEIDDEKTKSENKEKEKEKLLEQYSVDEKNNATKNRSETEESASWHSLKVAALTALRAAFKHEKEVNHSRSELDQINHIASALMKSNNDTVIDIVGQEIMNIKKDEAKNRAEIEVGHNDGDKKHEIVRYKEVLKENLSQALKQMIPSYRSPTADSSVNESTSNTDVEALNNSSSKPSAESADDIPKIANEMVPVTENSTNNSSINTDIDVKEINKNVTNDEKKQNPTVEEPASTVKSDVTEKTSASSSNDIFSSLVEQKLNEINTSKDESSASLKEDEAKTDPDEPEYTNPDKLSLNLVKDLSSKTKHSIERASVDKSNETFDLFLASKTNYIQDLIDQSEQKSRESSTNTNSSTPVQSDGRAGVQKGMDLPIFEADKEKSKAEQKSEVKESKETGEKDNGEKLEEDEKNENENKDSSDSDKDKEEKSDEKIFAEDSGNKTKAEEGRVSPSEFEKGEVKKLMQRMTKEMEGNKTSAGSVNKEEDNKKVEKYSKEEKDSKDTTLVPKEDEENKNADIKEKENGTTPLTDKEVSEKNKKQNANKDESSSPVEEEEIKNLEKDLKEKENNDLSFVNEDDEVKKHSEQMSKVKSMLDQEESKLRSSLIKKVDAIMQQYKEERQEFEKAKGIRTANKLEAEEKVSTSHQKISKFSKANFESENLLPKSERKFPLAKNMFVE